MASGLQICSKTPPLSQKGGLVLSTLEYYRELTPPDPEPSRLAAGWLRSREGQRPEDRPIRPGPLTMRSATAGAVVFKAP